MENERHAPAEGQQPVDEREEGELEEGEMDENATKSPSPRTTPLVPSARSLPFAGARGGYTSHGPATGYSSPAASSPTVQREQGGGAAQVGRSDGLPVRAPPTAPRALRNTLRGEPPTAPRAQRQASIGHTTNVPSTPRAPRDTAPPTGPRHAAQRRPASPHRDAPAAKRQRPAPVVINTVPDPLGVKILRLETQLNEKDKKIDDLQWALAESQALFHIYKTRGPEHFDPNLNEHIKRKFWKRNNPDLCKNNWRMDELSEISDEESVRSPSRPPSLPAHSWRPRSRQHSPPAQNDFDSKPKDVDECEPLPGDIFTVYDEGYDGVDVSCAFDDSKDPGGNDAVSEDLRAGADAQLRMARLRLGSDKVGSTSSAAQQLSRAELLENTAVVQYGLQFSYTLSLWQENGHWLPAPLGRFGQPYWKGSAWEDFDPRRLFMKEGVERVALDSKLFLELAQDAARIAFVYRSSTQRQVVSLALQHQIGLVNPNEPDMVSLCRTNPSRLPIAIRRHYRRNAAKNIFYTEFDAADISNHIILSLSGPQKMQDGLRRKNYHEQRRAWIQLVEVFVLEWLPLFSHRLDDPPLLAQDIAPWPLEKDLVKDGDNEDLLFTAMWKHLTKNGLPRRCLLPGGDCHDYVRRGHFMEQERKKLSSVFDQLCGSVEANQEARRIWVGDRLPYESVPEGFPVLRVKMGEERQKRLAMKYRERRDYKGFIPS